jgi:hypothetical protein
MKKMNKPFLLILLALLTTGAQKQCDKPTIPDINQGDCRNNPLKKCNPGFTCEQVRSETASEPVYGCVAIPTLPTPFPEPSLTPPTPPPSSPSPVVPPTPPPPTPPPASPPPPAGATDTVDIKILLFGGQAKKDNQSGAAKCQHGMLCTMIVGHEGIFTATPKQAPPCAKPNCDAQRHGYDITWAIGSQCDERPGSCVWFKQSADAGPFKAEVTGAEGFNLTVTCERSGGARLWVKLDEPQKPFYHSRDIVCR